MDLAGKLFLYGIIGLESSLGKISLGKRLNIYKLLSIYELKGG
ncbi:hypothetical protein C663_3400 [Bacillus subtilis XF-1]|nr:hypothetical protein C663_3400 [Bacillus subtilis XF-1]